MTFPRDSSELDLTALTSDEVDQALEKLSLLPKAEYVKLTDECEDGAGPTPEDVYRLQTAFPEILFDYSFTLWGKSVSNQDEVLDLSHNPNLDDIAFVSYMPDLEVAILAVNGWTDAAPLASCKDLEDISPLMEMTWLERLWVGRDNKVPEEDLLALQAALPDCVVNITNQYNPTWDGWRVGERYELLREQFDYDSGEFSMK